jgi:hypothetical protein
MSDDIAQDSHVKGAIVVIVLVLAARPAGDLDGSHGTVLDPPTSASPFLLIHMAGGNDRVVVVTEQDVATLVMFLWLVEVGYSLL